MKTVHLAKKTKFREMPPVLKKLVEDKKTIQAYLKGEVTRDELTKRGIKLAHPL
jgi:hypothetical protein